jgi:hypothetical protein
MLHYVCRDSYLYVLILPSLTNIGVQHGLNAAYYLQSVMIFSGYIRYTKNMIRSYMDQAIVA